MILQWGIWTHILNHLCTAHVIGTLTELLLFCGLFLTISGCCCYVVCIYSRLVCFLVIGVATVLTVAILSIPQLEAVDVAHFLQWLFLVFLPNYCLGQGLEDFYSNYEYIKICEPIEELCSIFPTLLCCSGNTASLNFLIKTILYCCCCFSYVWQKMDSVFKIWPEHRHARYWEISLFICSTFARKVKQKAFLIMLREEYFFSDVSFSQFLFYLGR